MGRLKNVKGNADDRDADWVCIELKSCSKYTGKMIYRVSVWRFWYVIAYLKLQTFVVVQRIVPDISTYLQLNENGKSTKRRRMHRDESSWSTFKFCKAASQQILSHFIQNSYKLQILIQSAACHRDVLLLDVDDLVYLYPSSWKCWI